jgi:2',3'-cyclic-nucleotide 2'-phosphodiesterase (5'-nucleotidase family)
MILLFDMLYKQIWTRTEGRKKRKDSLMKKFFPLFFLVLFFSLSSCSTSPPKETFTLTVFHTNDHHGHTLAYDSDGTRIGGLAERLFLINKLREESAGICDLCLLLDAGDVTTGTLFSDTFLAEPDWKVYGRYYDALAPGNHDFDFPLDSMLRLIDSFNVPVISANVFDRRTDTLLFPPYKIFRKDGWSVAVIGVSHPETPILSTLGNDERLEFLSAVEAAEIYAHQLKNDHDLLIILSHLGEDERLAKKVKGIDLIIGGHSHSPLKKPVKKKRALIVNAGYGGRYVGYMTLRLERKGRSVSVEMTDYELIPVSADIPPDKEVKSILQPYVAAFGDQGKTVVGEAGESFQRTPLKGPLSSSNLGNLVSDAYRFATDADFAFVNRGGLRADLDKGPVTIDELHAVLPFDNTLIVFEIKGSHVLKIIENLAPGRSTNDGLLFPSNLQIERTQSGKPAVHSLQGKPILPDKLYTVAVGSFIARGGDGHKVFLTFKKKYNTMIRTSDALRRYIEAKKTVFPDNQSRLK